MQHHVPVNFTSELWGSIEDIFDSIIAHPFLRGLTSGELQIDRFKVYVTQDALYLTDFSESLQVLASKAPRNDWRKKFLTDSKGVLEVERLLHESFLKEWYGLGVSRQPAAKNPTNMAYTSFILASVSLQSFHEGLASILPCYWIYNEVGKRLEKQGSPNLLYKRWIDTYSSAEYEKAVKEVLEMMDTVATTLVSSEKEKCKVNFRLASIYEYMFWDAAFNLENWKFTLDAKGE